jgi:hypothetical protein
VLDRFLLSNNIELSIFLEWQKNLLTPINFQFISIIAPELVEISFFNFNYIFKYYGDFIYFVQSNTISEVYFLPVLLIPHTIFYIFYFLLFLVFSFSPYKSHSKEESIIDYDYLVLSGGIESEKEIANCDDIVTIIVVILYIFG